MEIVAKARFVRMSPKKIMLVARPISKMVPSKALAVLKFSNKAGAEILSKLITSAIANAKHNFGLAESGLNFKKIEVGPGPIYKRWRAAARGRSHPIHKRTANITVILQGEQVKKAKDLEDKIVKSLQKPEENTSEVVAKTDTFSAKEGKRGKHGT